MNTLVSKYTPWVRNLITVLLLGSGCLVWAQDAGEAESSDEKADASIELRYLEVNNRSKVLQAIVKAKVDDFYQPVKGITLRFYRKEVAPENLIGTGSTNAKGMAYCDLAADESGFFSPSFDYIYLAAIEDNEKYNDTEEELTVAESDFDMTLQEEDSVRQVQITFQGVDENGEVVPVADAEVGIYVQRLFGLLRVTEDLETTDEDGSILVEFPSDIPGDSLGNLIIVAKVNEHERYGFLEFRRKINWGMPLAIDKEKRSRELWSSRANAPLYLIFTVNAVLIGIWGAILYIIFKLFQIKKLGNKKVITSN